MAHDGFDFLFGNKTTLQTLRFRPFRLAEQHIAQPNEVFSAGGIENNARVNARSNVEGDAVRDVRLDKACYDIGRRALRSDDHVDARRTSKLRNAANGEFDLFANVHHEVGELVDDDDDIRHLFRPLVFGFFLIIELSAFNFFIVLRNIAHARLRHDFQTALHFSHAP